MKEGIALEPVSLRLVTVADAEALLAIYAPFVRDTVITFEYDVPDAAAFAARIAEITPRYPYIAATVEGGIVGYAYAHKYAERAAYAWCAETSIYIMPAFCGRGIGGRLYRALLSLLAMQNIQNVFAGVSLPNPASERLHAAFGFKLVAVNRQNGYKCNRWVDNGVYVKFLGDHPIPPAPVIPFSKLDKDAVAARLL